jgi:hypothetical protein
MQKVGGRRLKEGALASKSKEPKRRLENSRKHTSNECMAGSGRYFLLLFPSFPVCSVLFCSGLTSKHLLTSYSTLYPPTPASLIPLFASVHAHICWSNKKG